MRGEQIAQAVGLAGFGRFADAEEVVMRIAPGQRGERRRGLHQGLGGAARFRDRNEARGGKWQLFEHAAERARIEVVDEMQPGLPQRAERRYGVAGQLRQGLAAKA